MACARQQKISEEENEKKPQHKCEQIKNLLDGEKQRLVYVYKKLMQNAEINNG